MLKRVVRWNEGGRPNWMVWLQKRIEENEFMCFRAVQCLDIIVAMLLSVTALAIVISAAHTRGVVLNQLDNIRKNDSLSLLNPTQSQSAFVNFGTLEILRTLESNASNVTQPNGTSPVPPYSQAPRCVSPSYEIVSSLGLVLALAVVSFCFAFVALILVLGIEIFILVLLCGCCRSDASAFSGIAIVLSKYSLLRQVVYPILFLVSYVLMIALVVVVAKMRSLAIGCSFVLHVRTYMLIGVGVAGIGFPTAFAVQSCLHYICFRLIVPCQPAQWCQWKFANDLSDVVILDEDLVPQDQGHEPTLHQETQIALEAVGGRDDFGVSAAFPVDVDVV